MTTHKFETQNLKVELNQRDQKRAPGSGEFYARLESKNGYPPDSITLEEQDLFDLVKTLEKFKSITKGS